MYNCLLLTEEIGFDHASKQNEINMKKNIGISFTTTNLGYYWSWFTEADLKRVNLVDLSFQRNNEADFHGCDGFILTGGVDIHPALYSGNSVYENMPREFQQERDRFETKIFQYSQENQKPLLGLCRGMQLVNVLQGGKLVQDLGVGDNGIHRAGDADKEHDVTIEKGTLLHQITGLHRGTVNSAHHQVVDAGAIGENLMVNAYSHTTTKLIEGIEFKDKTNKAFMLCVQWHPERIRKSQNLLSQNIKLSFIEALEQENNRR